MILVLDNHVVDNINIKDDSGATPLHWACGEGKEECVEVLIERGADINLQDFGGETPLHWASLNGHKIPLELLLAKGANINAKADNGFTPLHSATINSHLECVSLLLGKDADINAKDKSGKTPMAIAETRKNQTLLDYFNPDKRKNLEKIASLEKEIIAMKSKIEKEKEEHEDVARRLMNVYRDLISAEQEQKKINGQLNHAMAELEEQTTKKNELEQKVNSITLQLNDAKETNLKLESDLRSSNSQLQEYIKEEQQRILGQKERDLLYNLCDNFANLQTMLNEASTAVSQASNQIKQVAESRMEQNRN